MARYFDMFSKEISKEEYEKLRAHFEEVFRKHAENEPDTLPLNMFSVREFQNENLCVQLIWLGEISDKIVSSHYKSQYPIFKIAILNKRNDDRWYEEPLSKTHNRRSSADAEYEDILLKYSKCYYDEEGNFTYSEDNLSKCIHEQITVEGLIEENLPSITFKPKTNFDSVW
ncbi:MULTISPECIES: hypothetical protein [Acinetobacter]|jgi:hypothetical protein|uniref:Uncharacterized protein n=2 Tax=Acinetobacter baumannii TaxID=470 RepID=A0AAU8YS15_ACIBA|nr:MULTISPECIES: hypothetical protein [Acinetobacter]AGG91069.1 hypothetical protein ABTJ_p2057 [Acinetobacter baumannii MDR-TJ]AJB68898.1 hypothetical protein RU84_18675 [Acinetobacter baumannii]AKJ47826.1 hypothetical protein TE32_19760 [Acinetobacter baumannii]ANB90552.1 hypothetical protein SG90_019280 [Acinetobacter baumannii]APJ25287.1 hypothetical protein BS065_19620 [Acinetobacter baumannii]